MYKLYYTPGACSMAIHVLLNELGVAFETVDVSKFAGKTKDPEFLKINPRGAVPVLSDDGFVIREGAAIIIYLLDKHKSALLPREGKERAAALEWLCFANATMHPAYGKAFFSMKNLDKATQAIVNKPIFKSINDLWEDVDSRLASSPHVAGKDITAADILLSVIANWNGYFSTPVTLGKNVKRLLAEVSKRPSYQKALAAEGVEYKAAA